MLPALKVRDELFDLGDGFYLSPLASVDEASLVQHLREPEIARQSLRIPFPYTERDARTWIVLAASRARLAGRDLTWALRDARSQLVGCVGFEPGDPGRSHRAEIGYWIARSHWGRGLATRAVTRACEIGFGPYGYVRLAATVLSFNRASARVLEKCGFVLEGEHRKSYRREETFLDTRTYARVK